MRWKVCGITRAGDATAAVKAGADALGFVLWSGSPRAVSVNVAAAIAERVPTGVWKVGVFVDPTAAELDAAAADIGLDFVQLCGNEPPEALATAPRPAWKVLRLAPGAAADSVQRQADAYPDCTLVVDAGVPGEYGGTGQTADWEAAAWLASQRRVVLAGGLSPENVAAAIERVSPWGVDVSSALESAPGVKDEAKIEAFARALEPCR